MKKSNKKSSQQKRVLIASILLAGLITAGGTFAWFSSKDEVTNRLTAQGNFGVSVIETFTPPEEWFPGQVINKDVAAVNTGNVDAYVKATVSNSMVLTKFGDSVETFDATTNTHVEITPTEATSIMAGATLAYTSNISDQGKIGNITVDDTAESENNFKPSGSGVYIFRRNVKTETINTPNVSQFEYDGYYYNYDDGKYYALDLTSLSGTVDENGVFIKTGAEPAYNVTDIKYKTQTTIVVTPTLAYDTNVIKATYDNGTVDSDTDDIVIEIALDTNAATNWTRDTSASGMEFYLNQILAAGATSPNLIDSVTLSEDTKNDAYISFDYDLKITLDSAQITKGEDGKITAAALNVGGQDSVWNMNPAINNDGTAISGWTAPSNP